MAKYNEKADWRPLPQVNERKLSYQIGLAFVRFSGGILVVTTLLAGMVALSTYF